MRHFVCSVVVLVACSAAVASAGERDRKVLNPFQDRKVEKEKDLNDFSYNTQRGPKVRHKAPCERLFKFREKAREKVCKLRDRCSDAADSAKGAVLDAVESVKDAVTKERDCSLLSKIKAKLSKLRLHKNKKGEPKKGASGPEQKAKSVMLRTPVI